MEDGGGFGISRQGSKLREMDTGSARGMYTTTSALMLMEQKWSWCLCIWGQITECLIFQLKSTTHFWSIHLTLVKNINFKEKTAMFLQGVGKHLKYIQER